MTRVGLILGAGERIGQSLAKSLTQSGYTVAIASRSAKDWAKDYKHFTVDLGKPESVPKLFGEVRASIGAPSVVIYNGQLPLPSSYRIC